MITSDYFSELNSIVNENRQKHARLNNLVLQSVDNLSDLVKCEKISDNVQEFIKNIHSIRRKVLLTSYLLNGNEYQGASGVLRSLIEAFEVLIVFSLHPNEVHSSVEKGFKGTEEVFNKLRKQVGLKYSQNTDINNSFSFLFSIKNELSAGGAHTNYAINKSFTHYDFEEKDNITEALDTGTYNEILYLIFSLYLIRVVYFGMKLFLDISKDSYFRGVILFDKAEENQKIFKENLLETTKEYTSLKPEIIDLFKI